MPFSLALFSWCSGERIYAIWGIILAALSMRLLHAFCVDEFDESNDDYYYLMCPCVCVYLCKWRWWCVSSGFNNIYSISFGNCRDNNQRITCSLTSILPINAHTKRLLLLFWTILASVWHSPSANHKLYFQPTKKSRDMGEKRDDKE